MTKIFISYRREDAAGHARHLFENLVKQYGKRAIFMDITSIVGGEDFAKRIDQEVSKCDVFLALIGKRWLTAETDSGQRRLHQPVDYVRQEIESALKRDIKVIPVLLDNAEMPQKRELPEEISTLALHNAVNLSSIRWETDLEKIIELLPIAPRRWWWRGLALMLIFVFLGLGAMYARQLLWPAAEALNGSFNVVVTDFSELESGEPDPLPSGDGQWIADQLYSGVLDMKKQLEKDESMRGIVEIARVKKHIKGSNPGEISTSISRIAKVTNATIVIHGVLNLQDLPPYNFTPIIYLSPKFNGGEELSGNNAFGMPIEVTLPLENANRLDLANKIQKRLKALNLFTLGLAYSQINDDERALELFSNADRESAWDRGKEVLHLFRGSSLFKLKRNDEARSAYKQALDLTNGEYGRALIGLGNSFYQDGFIDRAAGFYQQAIKAKQNPPGAYVDTKAKYNLGLALASKAKALNKSCEAEDAHSLLNSVQTDQSRNQDISLFRQLSFKAYYQRALLYRSCVQDENSVNDTVSKNLNLAIEQLKNALELGQPRPAYIKKWYDFDWFSPTARLTEYPWQKDRWQLWNTLGYCQLQLAESGQPEYLDQAIESFEKVINQYERSRGDITGIVAKEAYKLMSRALTPTDHIAAQNASNKANKITIKETDL